MAQNPALLTAWKPSGVFSPLVLAAPVVAFIAALPLAALYALIDLYVPIFGIITVLALGAFAFGNGAIAGVVLGGGRSRNDKVNLLMSAVSSVIALYTLWTMFLFFFLRRVDQDPDLIAMFLSPGTLWDLMGAIGEQGWFTVKGSTPSGVLLWLFWIAEAICFFGVFVFSAFGVGSVVWCEACQVEMKNDVVVDVVAGSGLAEAARRGAASDVERMEPLNQPGLMPTERLSAHVCPKCTYTIATVYDVTRSTNEKGELQLRTNTTLEKHVVGRDFVTRAGRLAREGRISPPAPSEPVVDG